MRFLSHARFLDFKSDGLLSTLPIQPLLRSDQTRYRRPRQILVGEPSGRRRNSAADPEDSLRRTGSVRRKLPEPHQSISGRSDLQTEVIWDLVLGPRLQFYKRQFSVSLRCPRRRCTSQCLFRLNSRSSRLETVGTATEGHVMVDILTLITK